MTYAGRLFVLVMAALIALASLIAIIFGTIAISKSFGRHQRIADAKNEVHASQIEANNKTTLNSIRIKQQAQLVLVAKQEAQIRYQKAVGVREAQDEISKTLTPLYVQFEALETMREIGKYGNATIYIPSGQTGVPLVSGVGGSVK